VLAVVMGRGGIPVPGVLGGVVLARVVLHQGLQRRPAGCVGAQLQHPRHRLQVQVQLLAGGHAPPAELEGLQQRQQLRKQLQGGQEVPLLARRPWHPQRHHYSL
jgi:hypothetical protein